MKNIKTLNLQYKFKFSLFLLYLLSSSLFSQIKPPNYNFSLDQLRPFFPQKKITNIPAKHGKGDKLKENNGINLLKYTVKHVRYVFPVFVQEQNGVILDFYTRLPTYFLHDLFHQSLINRYKKQDLYLKKEREAVYIWKNIGNVKLTYGAACTITCFPVYLTGKRLNGGAFKSTLELMEDQLKLLKSP